MTAIVPYMTNSKTRNTNKKTCLNPSALIHKSRGVFVPLQKHKNNSIMLFIVFLLPIQYIYYIKTAKSSLLFMCIIVKYK